MIPPRPTAPARWRALRDDPRSATAILILASVASVVAVLWFGRGTTFSGDEAVWVAATPGIDLRTVFEPHGGHLLALTRLVYWPLLEVFGLAYLPFRLLAIAATLLAVWLLFVFGRRRTDQFVALAPCLVLLFFGSDYLHLLQGNGFTVMLSVALGLAALLSLEGGTRRGDLLACLWLVIGVLAYTVILPFVAGAAVLLLLRRGGERRLWVALVPAAVYAGWRVWLLLADVSSAGGAVEPSNLALVPSWGFQAVSAILNALTGLSYSFAGGNVSTPLDLAGPPLAVAFIAFAGWMVARRGLRSGLLVAAVILLSLFTIQALASGASGELRTPGDARYMYPGAVVLLLVAFELVRGWKPGRPGLLALGLIALCGVAANLILLRDNAAFVRDSGAELRSLVGATELALEGDPQASAGALAGQRSIGLGPVFGLRGMALQDYGQFGYGPDELRQQPPERRETADFLLVTSAVPGLAPPGPDPRVAGCRTVASAAGGPVSLESPPGRLLLRAAQAGEVSVGRFADLPGVAVGTLEPGRPAQLLLPADSAPDPWRIAFDGPSLKVCR